MLSTRRLLCVFVLFFFSFLVCDSVEAIEWHVGTVFSLRAIHSIVHDLLANSPGHFWLCIGDCCWLFSFREFLNKCENLDSFWETRIHFGLAEEVERSRLKMGGPLQNISILMAPISSVFHNLV